METHDLWKVVRELGILRHRRLVLDLGLEALVLDLGLEARDTRRRTCDLKTSGTIAI